jgi:hypothetical protein
VTGGANCQRKQPTALCSGGRTEYALSQLAGGSDTRSKPGRRDRAEPLAGPTRIRYPCFLRELGRMR